MKLLPEQNNRAIDDGCIESEEQPAESGYGSDSVRECRMRLAGLRTSIVFYRRRQTGSIVLVVKLSGGR